MFFFTNISPPTDDTGCCSHCTKVRTHLLKPNTFLTFGKYATFIEHLIALIEKVPRDCWNTI